jgi:hypothetical protein
MKVNREADHAQSLPLGIEAPEVSHAHDLQQKIEAPEVSRAHDLQEPTALQKKAWNDFA